MSRAVNIISTTSPTTGLTYRYDPVYKTNYAQMPTGLYTEGAHWEDTPTLIMVYNPTGKTGRVYRGIDAIKKSRIRLVKIPRLNNQVHRVGDILTMKSGNRYRVLENGELELVPSNKINTSNKAVTSQDLTVTKTKSTNISKNNKNINSNKSLNTKVTSENSNQQISGDYYTVKYGDTLYAIAKKAGLNLSEIKALNPQIKNINRIYIGDKINISKKEQPKQEESENSNQQISGDYYTVKYGDTLYAIAKKAGLNLSEIKALNPQIKNINRIYIGDKINISKKEQPKQEESEKEVVQQTETPSQTIENTSNIPTNATLPVPFSADLEGKNWTLIDRFRRFRNGGLLKYINKK